MIRHEPDESGNGSTEVRKTRKERNLDQEWLAVKSAAQVVLPALGRELNKLHGISYSTRVWNLLLGDWLLQFAAVVLNSIADDDQTFAERLPDHKLRPPIWRVPSTSRDFAALATDNEWLCLLRTFLTSVRQSQGSYRAEFERFELASSSTPKGIHRVRRFFGRAVLSVVSLVWTRRKSKQPRIVFFASNLPAKSLLWLASHVPGRAHFEPFFSPKIQVASIPNSRFRNWALPLKPDESFFVRALKTLVTHQLPFSLLEDFEAFTDAAQMTKVNHADVIFTSSGLYSSDVFRFWAASQVNSGCKLIIGQHGGGANLRVGSAFYWEASIADRHGVSGPGNVKSSKDFVMGQFWSGLHFRTTRVTRRRGVLISGIGTVRPFDMRSMPQGDEWLDHFDFEHEFVRLLPKGIRQELEVRLYPGDDFGWQRKFRWQTAVKEVVFDGREFAKSIEKASIVIVTYQGSAYAELLRAGVPTVLCWDPDLWPIEDSALPAFYLLEETGIYHPNSQSAARHVSAVWADIEAWWNEESVINAREEFLRLYAVNGGYAAKSLLREITSTFHNS